MEIGAPEQFAALALHPLRQRLLFATRPAARRHQPPRGTARRQEGQRRPPPSKCSAKPGWSASPGPAKSAAAPSQYHRRAARGAMHAAEPQAAGTAAMLAAFARGLDRSPAETLTLRHLRLHPGPRREELGDTLTRSVDEAGGEGARDQPSCMVCWWRFTSRPSRRTPAIPLERQGATAHPARGAPGDSGEEFAAVPSRKRRWPRPSVRPSPEREPPIRGTPDEGDLPKPVPPTVQAI
ncbi:hypothetical protein ACU686_05380 [Yinghuangia aomiensis]